MRTSVVNSKYIFTNGIRFEGKYYLNENSFLSMQIEKNISRTQRLEELASVFNPPVFKRQFCNNTNRSVQYFQSSDVPNANERSSVYVFKGQADSLNLLVKEGDILVTGFGTIGNTRIVSKLQDNTCYANNVCRIRVNDISNRGFIYAFLSSKYGYSQLNKNASGSVVRYIEAPGIKKTMIPIFDQQLKITISELIDESAKLREEAIESLEISHRIIEEILDIKVDNIKHITTVQSILKSHNRRFEASYHISENRRLYDYLINNYRCQTLKDYTERIFRPGIFKREYVNRGVTFLGGADITLAIPSSDKQLSYRQVEAMPELKINKGWILATCGGTIGNTVYVDQQLSNCAISQHVMRIVPKNNISTGFLYSFLSSKIGYQLITMFTYGAVIPQVEPHHLELVPIPEIDSGKQKEIEALVDSYVTKLEQSKEKELSAIHMVEQEIEKWNN